MRIEAKNLIKIYGDRSVVNDVTFDINKGEVVCLLGPNGAGKTTTFYMVVGLVKPNKGHIFLDGEDISAWPMNERARAGIGYLPQDFGYYPSFTGWDFLMYMSTLKGFDKKSAHRRIEELLDFVSLSSVARKKIKTYSGGMKQRLGIAQALLNHPKILVMDEPTAGLDPKERVRFRNVIENAGKESIVILSTHIVSDVEHIADYILMMKDGRLIFNAPSSEIEGSLEEFYLNEFE